MNNIRFHKISQNLTKQSINGYQNRNLKYHPFESNPPQIIHNPINNHQHDLIHPHIN